MYNWRLRKEADESDKAFLTRVLSVGEDIARYLLRASSYSPVLTGYTGVIYCHSELGDDTYQGADLGSAEHPYKSFSAIVSAGLTDKAIIACGRFSGSAAGNLIVADTYGSVVWESVPYNGGSAVGCYAKLADRCGGTWVNCVIDGNGKYGQNGVWSFIGCAVLNFIINTGPLRCWGNTFLNSTQTDRISNVANEVGNSFVNCRINITSNPGATTGKIYLFNCDVNNAYGADLSGFTHILNETYQSANDCFVDPIHLNFAVKRSEVRAGTPFTGWLGFTGDSVDFVKVTGNNIQSDSGSWTIDQQTPGEGRLLGAIVDSRGQFNNVFTGFNNVVFHYNSNNISIGPHEKFGTPTEVSAGENETLTITDGGMYCVSKDCEIDDVPVSKYQNIWLEAGSYSVDSSNGVKFFPYNYESINNYVGCRFTNLGKCTTYAAGRTLKANCSYLNQGSADVTVSDGTVVAPGKTYVTPDLSEYTADGNLLLVFDDTVDNFVWFSTNSFQTKYKAGYVVVNKKTEQNLLTRDGKTIPCTEAFGEYNDIRYLASQNEQSDFFQVVVDYKVYPF